MRLRCHYTKSNPSYDHSNISSKRLQKHNFKPLGHYTCMQCGTSHLQTVQENILSHIILATYRKFTVATVRFTQNVSCNVYTPQDINKWQMSLCNNSSDNKSGCPRRGKSLVLPVVRNLTRRFRIARLEHPTCLATCSVNMPASNM